MSVIRRILFGGFASTMLGFGAFSGVASAQDLTVKDSVTASELEAMLTAAGLSPTMLTDKKTGAPVATGQAAGMVFVVRALECEGRPKRCERLVMFANFDLGRNVADDDFRIVNVFNETNVYGRAYVLEDRSQIGVDFIIDMTGGVTGNHIGSRLNRWPSIIEDFRDEMIAAQTGS